MSTHVHPICRCGVFCVFCAVTYEGDPPNMQLSCTKLQESAGAERIEFAWLWVTVCHRVLSCFLQRSSGGHGRLSAGGCGTQLAMTNGRLSAGGCGIQFAMTVRWMAGYLE